MVDKIHIVMAADGPYMKGLEVAKASMIASCSDPARLEFHLFGEDAGLACRIRGELGTYKGSPMAFVRLYLGELLNGVDWVVYSDVDTLWHGDVVELWDARDETKMVQWVQDIPSTRAEASVWQRRINSRFDESRYGCSGVMLMNLKKMRAEGFLEKAIVFTKEHGLFKYVDQDILNALCNKSCGMLPGWWDVLIPSPENAPRCVLHLTGVGRCFARLYSGKVIQYLYWQHAARGTAFHRPFALPFYLRDWMIRLCLPLSGAILRDRIRRYFAWRWFFRNFYSSI